MKKEDKELKRATYYLLPDKIREIKVRAAEEGRNVSEIVREAVDSALQDRGQFILERIDAGLSYDDIIADAASRGMKITTGHIANHKRRAGYRMHKNGRKKQTPQKNTPNGSLVNAVVTAAKEVTFAPDGSIVCRLK